MNRCPITYEECSKGKYSLKGLRLLSPTLSSLKDLPWSAEEQRSEALTRVDKMSIQGVQLKLSARLNVSGNCFDIVSQKGQFILKPPHAVFPNLPENEDLTMRLGAVIGIETPLHGLLYAKDGSFTYFIRRFDRSGRGHKIPLEDFAQLCGKSRETKYDSSMEQVASLIEKFTTFPAKEKIDLFKRTLFSFLTGNEDMHLKNFSVIRRNDVISLAPAYDFLNTTLALKTPAEELALPLKGKKRRFTKNDFFKYFAAERLALNNVIVDEIMDGFVHAVPEWKRLIAVSFLPARQKERYESILDERMKRMGLFAT